MSLFETAENPLENEANLVELTPITLKKIANGQENGGYVIISSSGCVNKSEKYTLFFEQLKKRVEQKDYAYVPVYGSYRRGNIAELFVASLMVFPMKKFSNYDNGQVDFDTFVSDMFEIVNKISKRNDRKEIIVKLPNNAPKFVNAESGLGKNIFDGKDYFTQHEDYEALKKWNLRRIAEYNGECTNCYDYMWDNGDFYGSAREKNIKIMCRAN